MGNKRSKQTFIEGALILIIANLLVKVIGAGFKIPLAWVLGEEGMGIFSTAYNLYAALFVIATAGIPVAVSKMVSESIARNNRHEVKRIFDVARVLLLIIGSIGAVALFFGASSIETAIEATSATAAIKAVAPSLILVALMSAYRGYFQGHQNMIPTAISEVSESLGKLAIGLLLAYVFTRTFDDMGMPAAGAVLGVTAGTLFGLVSIVLIHLKVRKKDEYRILSDKVPEDTRSRKRILKILVMLAVPITIGASVSTLTNMLDMVMVRRQLVSLGYDNLVNIVKDMGISQITWNDNPAEYIRNMANAIYGSYTGYAVTLFNFPPTLVTAISVSIVPAIASAFVLNKKEEAKATTESALRITMLIATPCAFGLAILAKPVLDFVFSSHSAAGTLSILGYAVISMSVVSVTTAMLQGTGKIMIPVINMTIGGIIKVLINYFLVGMPQINILGAPIGTNVCYLTITVLNLIWVKRMLNPKLRLGDFLLKPVVSSALMAGAAYFVCKMLGEGRLALLVGIAVAVVVYFGLMFIFKGIKREDVRMFPKGEAIEKILTKYHLI